MTGPLAKTRRVLGGTAAVRTVALAYAAYLLVERIGVFRVLPATWREALHSLPSLVLSLVVVLLSLGQMIAVLRGPSGRERTGRLLLCGGVILLAAGLWVSYLTRFEGRTLRAEGESFNAFPGEYVRESVFQARYARFPHVGISLLALEPSIADDPSTLREVAARILYAGQTTSTVRQRTLSSRWPLLTDWTFIWITDFGYQLTYVLSDRSERVLESNTVYQKLYPPGAEEYFRTQYLGYLFYVRCYPDYRDKAGRPATLTAEPRNPMFNLRIVRNKDIVYNGLLSPSEKVRFDNAVISIPDVRMWVELRIVRDLGLPVAAAGVLLLTVGALLLYGKGRSRRDIP